MNQMYNEVEVLEQSFQALEVGDFELKVENIKKRINLLRQKEINNWDTVIDELSELIF